MLTVRNTGRDPGGQARDRLLVLLAVLAHVRSAEFDLAVHAGRFGAFLLVLVLLRLLLFSVAAHLALRHGDLQTFDGDSICEWRSVAHPSAQRTVLQLCFSSSGGLVSSVDGSASARLALRNAVFSSLFRCFSSLRARAALARSARSRP